LSSVARGEFFHLLLPYVDADGVAGGQSLGCADQEEPVPAPDVEDVLVATPGQAVEESVGAAVLTDLATPEVQSGVPQGGRAGPNGVTEPVRPPTEKGADTDENQRCSHERGAGQDGGRIDSVVGS
jgi:hypothetical protein